MGVLMMGFALPAAADETPAPLQGTFRSASTAVKFDVSPPLSEIPIRPPADLGGTFFGSLMIDPDPPGKPSFGPQDQDGRVQGQQVSGASIPAPSANFNVGMGTANPPDPVGDVGPTHYVRMANASFQIFNKTTGASVFGPANINTLFAGFGGACETENAGDPIVLYDQIADRWLLTQFSDSTGPGFFNCVALSTTSNPLGTYHRWAFSTATFPDYPKYGIWPNAYLISTREVNAGVIGAYAIDRAAMLAGNPAPPLIQFIVPVNEFSGDGLLPADLDGSTPPPPGTPGYYLGSMDNGGPYGAVADALSLWEFDINFAVPASSTFTLVDTIPIAPYDTIFPCVGRSCIPQPAPLGAVDILSYRQRPMHRAAYRNFGSYQSIVSNQSVEAGPSMAGIRWWEIRNPGANSVLYQDSTYAPGLTDGLHRWMASVAQDASGNIGMGFSAGSATVFPSVHYTGRLQSDPLNTMALGEGIFVTGGGGHSAATRRWGDYTSMNVDSSDDCTFWYVNEFFAATGTTWTLRAGAFKFPDCGSPNLGIAALPMRQAICTPADAIFDVEANAYSGFTSDTTLSVTGVPAGATSLFSPAVISPAPGVSTLTIGNTGAIAAGSYTMTVSGASAVPPITRSRTVDLDVFTTTPAGPTAVSPAPAADGISFGPTLSWTAAAQAESYVAEVATDPAFANIVFTSAATTATSVKLPPILSEATTYHWRVRGSNICGTGTESATATFTTRFAPGVCGPLQEIVTGFSDDMESGVNGWTTDPVSGTTWTRTTARPSSGAFSWLAVDVAVTSDQRLISPSMMVPALAAPTLRFRHDVTMEINTATSCFDGGFVEVSTNDGASWLPLDPSSQLEDPYVGPLSTGERAWCGTEPYTTASFDLSDFAGQTVRFRFRALTDGSVGSVPHGWYVDDVRIENCDVSDTFFKNGFE